MLTRELGTAGGEEGSSATSEVDGAAGDGTGDCSRPLLVPVMRSVSLSSGTGATVVFCASVVVVEGSCSLVLTKRSGDVEADCERIRVSNREVKSGKSRVSMSEELLLLLLEGEADDEVATAGAVVFVRLWRLTCRGK